MVELQEGAGYPLAEFPTSNYRLPTTPTFQFPSSTTTNHQLFSVLGTCDAVGMEQTDWSPKKPYDVRERVFEFGCLIIRLAQYLHSRGPVASELSAQVLKAGTSAPANYEDADDATGNRDKAAKRRITGPTVLTSGPRGSWVFGVVGRWSLGVGT